MYASRFYPLAFRFSSLTIDTKLILLGNVELLSFIIDCGDHFVRQLNTQYKRIKYLYGMLEIRMHLRIGAGLKLIARLGLHQLIELIAQFSLRTFADLTLNLLTLRGVDLL